MRGRIVAIGGGIVAVAAGGIVAVSVSASSGSTTAARPPAQVARPAAESSAAPSGPAWSVSPTSASAPPVTTSPTPTSTRTGSVTYVVKPGDNLFVISAWFHLHGYGALYDANRAVIGADPALIFPGERITITGGHLTTSGR